MLHYRDLACYDVTIDDKTLQQSVFTAIDYNLNGISVLPCYLKKVIDIIPEGFVLSCVIDYPNGNLHTTTRSHAAIKAIHGGANAIDLVISHNDIINKNLDKLTDDIESILRICKDNHTTLRLMLEYRLNLLELETLRTIVTVANELGIEYFFPSTGFRVDSYIDNILVGKYLSKNIEINVITNGNFWTKDQYIKIIGADLYGVRFHNQQALKNLLIKK